MADRLGLYYKTGGVESGGTNALTGLLTGGTLISDADAETEPFAFPALDTVYTLYYRAIDSVTLDDAGNDTTAAFTITAPTGVEVCDTHNGTFGSSVSVAAATGAYKPVYVKQTARQASAEADLEVGTGGVTFTTGTRPTVGTVTPTGGDAQVTLAWSDIAMTGTGHYEVQRSTASNFGANLVTLTSSLADGSTGYTNNAAGGNAPSNGTAYYYRVRAVDARGVGAYSATGSVTPAAADPGITGTYYGSNTTLTGSIKQLVASPPNAEQLLQITTAEGSKTILAEVAVINSSQTVQRRLQSDGTWGSGANYVTVGTQTAGTWSLVENQSVSWSDPNITTGEYFAVRFTVQGYTGSLTPWLALAAATNTGAQTSADIGIWVNHHFDDEEAFEWYTELFWAWHSSWYSRIIFNG